jgi:hypothetical protein
MLIDAWRAAAGLRIRRAAALGLFVSFFLPISQCTFQPDESGIEEDQVLVLYPYAAYPWPSLERVATYAAFLWPIGLTVARKALPAALEKIALPALELLLCLGSAWMLFALTALGEVKYGAYLAVASLAAYSSATLAGVVHAFRRRVEDREPQLPRPNG